MSLRSSFPRLLALSTLLASLAASQAFAQQTVPRDDAEPADKSTEQTIERIHHEDKNARIDELRVGGETKNITVQPKGDVPAYQVAPDSNNRNPADAHGSSGWNILKY